MSWKALGWGVAVVLVWTNPAMTSVTPVCTLADLILYAPTRTALIAA